MSKIDKDPIREVFEKMNLMCYIYNASHKTFYPKTGSIGIYQLRELIDIVHELEKHSIEYFVNFDESILIKNI